ncbi:MAG TPA: hypothetical protein VF463_20750 [Sphingobium sp.]
MGTAAFGSQIVDYLSRQLEVEDWYKRHPEIDEQEIVTPLIDMGLPGPVSAGLPLGANPAVRPIREMPRQLHRYLRSHQLNHGGRGKTGVADHLPHAKQQAADIGVGDVEHRLQRPSRACPRQTTGASRPAQKSI